MNVNQHEYSMCYSGMVCDALVVDAEGYGEDCGKSASDPIHYFEGVEL